MKDHLKSVPSYVWGIVLANLIVTGLIAFLILDQSYIGRKDIVASQRASCIGYDTNFGVPLLNTVRAQYNKNVAQSKDKSLTPAQRKSASNTAKVELTSLQAMDHRIDPSTTGKLNPAGKKYIHSLVKNHTAFSCNTAYPGATIKLF